MRRRGRNVLRALLALLLAVVIFAAFWFGLVPQRFSPFASISLDDPPTWFLDPRLAALRNDPELCRAVLRAPHIVATPIPDMMQPNGCGWTNAVRVREVGGAELGLEQLTCETSAALALWVEHDLQPLAVATFGSRVVWMQDMGTYSCRNIIGNKRWVNMRSQHSLANAVDIGGFRLENGKQMSIAQDYKADSPEGHFLREAHMRACRYFRVAIGPEFNEAHREPFPFRSRDLHALQVIQRQLACTSANCSIVVCRLTEVTPSVGRLELLGIAQHGVHDVGVEVQLIGEQPAELCGKDRHPNDERRPAQRARIANRSAVVGHRLRPLNVVFTVGRLRQRERLRHLPPEVAAGDPIVGMSGAAEHARTGARRCAAAPKSP